MRLPHSWQLGASVLFSNASLLAYEGAGTANPMARASAAPSGAGVSALAPALAVALAIAWKAAFAARMGPAAASATGVSVPRFLNPFGVVAGPGSSREMTPAFSLRSAVRNFDASQRKR